MNHPFDYRWTPDPQYDGNERNRIFINTHSSTPEVVFGQVRYSPGGFCGPRIQRDYQLVLIYSGQCYVKWNDQILHLTPGVVYLFRPGQHEHFIFDKNNQTLHFWCTITPRFFTPKWQRRLDQSATQAPFSEHFQMICTLALSLGPIHTQNAREVINSLGLTLFAEYLRMANDHVNNQHRDEYANRAVRYMEKHYGEHNCIPQALKTAGCSRNTLIYKFQKQFGITPARYLWKLRIEKGLTMLRQTGLTIAEISDRCGFKNPFHFSRSIRTTQGIPPRAIRKSVWKS